MLNASTKIAGIMGWPIQHSLSPQIHNTFFQDLKLNYVYIPLPVQPQDLAQAVVGARAVGVVGFNVTIPHKIAIMRYLDDIDAMAQRIGAVNTVVCKNGQMLGYNTDAAGFIRAFKVQGITVAGKKAAVLGAGGAARAVVCGLTHADIAEVQIFARRESQAAALAHDMGKNVFGHYWSKENLIKSLGSVDILVHCTSLGMSPKFDTEPDMVWDALKAEAVVCDVVYNPLKTKFLQQAERYQHQTVNGTGMLVYQAGLSFELWTGHKPKTNKILRIVSNLL